MTGTNVASTLDAHLRAAGMEVSLPKGYEARHSRKEYPVASGVLDYFPDAIREVARVSWVGNQQHNPGQPLHWNRALSTDEPDALMRHFLERGKLDTDGVRHSAKVAWRALAMLQKELEAERRFRAEKDKVVDAIGKTMGQVDAAVEERIEREEQNGEV